MKHPELTKIPATNTGMIIRKTVADVFEAIVNPDIRRKFWFTTGTGRLEVGKPVQWDRDMYDVLYYMMRR